MKKCWLVLLSLGLIVAFSTSVFAVDVKFSGTFEVGGMYLDKTSFRDGVADEGPSSALYFQKLRVKTDLIVAPGLTLVTRFDAMERAWGATRSAPGTALDTQSAGTRAENENIAFDWAYVNYVSNIGIWDIGFQSNSTWGTVFGNSNTFAPKIKWSLPIGPWTVAAQIVKSKEGSRTAINPSSQSDADSDMLYLHFIYKWKTGSGGVLYIGSKDASNSGATPGYKSKNHRLNPYFKAKLGPVDLQGEFTYLWGKAQEFEDFGQDIDVSSMTGFLDATATFKAVYVGATFSYVSGDDPGTTDKIEGGSLNGGNDWNPCVILWNFDRANWIGATTGYSGSSLGTAMANAFFYQLRVGAMPIDKLDIMASISYAYADQKPTGYESDKYGWEVDLVGTYKITNNLSYMLGAGYLFTGDYYKGATNGNIGDDFMVINKLTLTF